MKDQVFNGIIVPKECVFCKHHPSNSGSKSIVPQTTAVQQLKAEIRAILNYLDMCSYSNFTAEKYDITKRRLRELSAV
jgi:hypothetical protein